MLGRCRGGFFLSQPRTALEIIARVREALPPHIPVTVKMRRGIDDSSQSRDNFDEIFLGAFARGGRRDHRARPDRRSALYRPSNWDILADIKRQAGESTSSWAAATCLGGRCVEMIAQTGLDGVSIARGAIGNPWIFQQVRDAVAGRPVRWPSLFEQRDVFGEHFRTLA